MQFDDSTNLSWQMWEDTGGSYDPFGGNLPLIDRVLMIRLAESHGFPKEIIEELLDSTHSLDWMYWIRNYEEGARDKKGNPKSRYVAKKAAVRGLVQAACASCGGSFIRKKAEKYCSSACKGDGMKARREQNRKSQSYTPSQEKTP